MVFTFKGDQNPVVITSKNTYNDDAWHMIEVNRDQSFSKLAVDQNDISDSSQKVNVLEINLPFYVGGLSPDSYNQVQANLVSILFWVLTT